MIYLDVNAFYEYYGRDKLPLTKSNDESAGVINTEKLRDFLDLNCTKCLPACVFMEIVVRFRDDPSTIRRINAFISRKNIHICNSPPPCYQFEPNELVSLYLTDKDEILKQNAYYLLEEKIKIESHCSYEFLQIISMMYADYYLNLRIALGNCYKDHILNYFAECFKELKTDYISQLNGSLYAGYNQGKTTKFLKDKYIELLVQNCTALRIIIDTVQKQLEDENDFEIDIRAAIIEAQNDGITSKKIMNEIVKRLGKNVEFMNKVRSEIPAIYVRRGYSKHQANYMSNLFEAWLLRGQHFKVNNIFDLIYVGSIDRNTSISHAVSNALVDQSSYLLTFDNALKDFVYKSEGNRRLINQFII